MRIPFDQLQAEFERVLLTLAFTKEKADLCARIFAENSRDGVETHGLNRFPTFVKFVKEGLIRPDAEPIVTGLLGAIERWDGNLAPGMYNATLCMDRAMKLADDNGIGCVAIRNTNHWMRGGTYGWQAADAGYIGICFTNTIANVPPWGGIEPRLGNNPFVIAVPRQEGNIVVDMAMSQYSYGKIGQYAADKKQLPLPGGYDKQGNLTTDPEAIRETQRALPIGFWKGSGLSMILDVLLTALTGGKSVAAITNSGNESGVSQCFICIKNPIMHEALINELIEYTKSSALVEPDSPIRYPGESTLARRQESLETGVHVNERYWQELLAM
ncbi:3-dehydro-L-gulonate 2-dehydrogenase [uncultured Fibrella sp.]|uniref:3-dehydro-L-gulonate 2-dehydrogenase n=1 Tax=uncultured Fibrella sp. TaxID=1284596 RepID=UPI0035C9A48C